MDSKNKINIETTADIIVIGAGGCGLAAAVTAAEKGANVAILEKMPSPGGNSILAFGIFGSESPTQRRLEVDVPKDAVFKYAMDWAHWKINPLIERAFIEKSGDTISWLEDKGMYFDKVPLIYNYFNFRTFHVVGVGPDGKEVANTGREVTKRLRKICDESGVQIYSKCKANKIVLDKTGRVAGVTVDYNGKEIQINAKSVIIATGGYGGNKELLKKYHPSYNEHLTYSGLPHLTGDGIKLAEEAGAATESSGTLLLSLHFCKPIHSHSSINDMARDPHTMWVNMQGERFTSEWITDHAFAVYRQRDKCLYALFDEKFKRQFIQETRHLSGFCGTSDVTIIPGAPLDDDIASESERGAAKVAESWGEIASWMGIPAEVLEETIEKYNLACDQRYDPIFNKDRRYLDALRTPPYYAIRCYQDFHTAIGNIKINQNMEVLNQQHSPIPGLYAGGDSCGGWSSDVYCIGLAGHAFGFAINSGCIAGENAAKYIRIREKQF